MKTVNKWKRKGNKVLPALKEKNLTKFLKENDKNFLWLLDRSKRERKVFWKVLNSEEHVINIGFKKLSIRISIDRKLDLIDRKYFDWSNSNRELIETHNQSKTLIAISIKREIGSIDRNSGKTNFLKNKAFLCRNSSKQSILWIKCMSMRWNTFQKHLFWT